MSHRILGLIGVGLLLVSPTVASAQTLVTDLKFNDISNLGLDSSGLGNNYTNTSVTSGTDRFGVANRAGSFNGSSSKLTEFGGLTGYDGLPGFTFAAWINRSSADAAFSGIISQDAGGCCTTRFLLDGGDTPYINAGLHADFDYAAPVIANDSWVHVVMTSDDSVPGNAVQIYVNGVLAGSNTFGHNLPNASLLNSYIGVGENGAAHFFQGLMDDVQIYDGVLTAQQITNLFQSGSIAAVPEPASIGLWTVIAVGLVGAGWMRRQKRRAS